MNEQTKVLCQCPEGYCFLEEDAARAKQNYAAQAQTNERDTTFRSRTLFHQLDDERLRRKSEWLESLGVPGTLQVQCRKEDPEAL